MKYFSENFFEQLFDFEELDRTVAASIRLAVRNPTSLYLFFQRYTYFNGYVSSMIPRLVSSIAISRYLFNDPHISVVEEADRGMQIAAKVMVAAADEGAYGASHRSLAQATLKAVGNYAGLLPEQRNQFSLIPPWLNEIIDAVISGYQGTPGDIASLIRAIGFHSASEILGDLEYKLLDKIIRYEHQGIGFDQYLRQEASPVTIDGHRYDPWCYVLIHSKHEGSGAEIQHFECALEALNMLFPYRPELEHQKIMEWVLEGFQAFVSLQQCLFREIYRECLELIQTFEPVNLVSA
ncbi:hypothetical protein H6G76_19585 [Nostoc sp. FACHB-152]|uniref:hypothetical protein n=1 Tax=unclassified Nostoc TaxID=2593658 RepID=UPI001681FDA9|nr:MULTISPECIES: hypothetical protein [unclassified Nostoc]MBD2449321.1 hypothetical protein [Nostoc sp. FACHB-152]MBD2470511.1 hypothetical protein [Nostoc sp. FACHB-145]